MITIPWTQVVPVVLALLPAAFAAPPIQPPPPTPKEPVVDAYHGVKVEDDYRWLENGGDAKVKEWSDAQNARARAFLDALPHRAEIAARVRTIMEFRAPRYGGLVQRGGTWFAMKFAPPKQQPMVVTFASPEKPAGERVLVDPTVIDPSGATTIDFYVPSPDGRRLAISLSKNGTESGDVSVIDVATGQRTGEVVPRVNGGTAGGSVAWSADGTGFFYTRYPRGNERPPEDLDFFQQVWFHRLGTPTESDAYEIGKDFPRVAEIQLITPRGGAGPVVAQVANGDGGEFAHWLRSVNGTWTQVTEFADKVVEAAFADDGTLYLVSRKDAPRGKVLRLGPGKTSLAEAQVVVPEGEPAIEGIRPTKDRLYVVVEVGGPSQVRVFTPDGKARGVLPTLPISSVSLPVPSDSGAVYAANASYTQPSAWYRFDPSGKKSKTALATKSPVSFADIVVRREIARSKDGTEVPITVLMKKGLPNDGARPTLLTAYGGYGISQVPVFNATLAVWLEQGGVFAEANLRGGGEFGEAWHEAGKLTRKQNVFDDFFACARRLIDLRYTNTQKLAIEGGSNGGLLMGATMTQHPDLVRAVVSFVGIYDSLRFENSPNGVFNVTELGTVKDKAQFDALYAYSPYHHVQDGTPYPAVLLLTGANDPRVDPMHSRKFAARLQAATSSKDPVLLRTSSKTGHGIGSPLEERVAETVDVWSFLFYELGVKYVPRAT